MMNVFKTFSYISIILIIYFLYLYFLDISNYSLPEIPTSILYTFPEESAMHEGTWLQWPHHFQYGKQFRNDLDQTWITLTKELKPSENVHIIAYNEKEINRIMGRLMQISLIPGFLTN